MPGYFGPMICARSLRFSLVFLGILTSWMTTSAQEVGRSESYIESNWGLANITGFSSDRGAVFPGTSVLAGGRHFISRRGFLEVQGGLAFPSVLTAKLGGGAKWDSGWSLSTGIRVFPLHGYLQTGVPTARCNRDLSERKQRRLARQGKTSADLKCSEWVFSFEISMLGLQALFPEMRKGLTDAEFRDRWEGPSLQSLRLITAGHRWMF